MGTGGTQMVCSRNGWSRSFKNSCGHQLNMVPGLSVQSWVEIRVQERDGWGEGRGSGEEAGREGRACGAEGERGAGPRVLGV